MVSEIKFLSLELDSMVVCSLRVWPSIVYARQLNAPAWYFLSVILLGAQISASSQGRVN